MWTLLDGFQHLSSEELEALLQAPIQITILVGAADGELDREERVWTDRLMQSRTYSKPKELNDFYRVVAEDFLEKVDLLLSHYPEDTELRNQQISDALAALNAILTKLDIHLAADLYKSYVGLAVETAKASGGFLRIGAISSAESQWINLPMLTPVKAPKTSKGREKDAEQDDWKEDLD